MKKLVLSLIALALSLSSFAQISTFRIESGAQKNYFLAQRTVTVPTNSIKPTFGISLLWGQGLYNFGFRINYRNLEDSYYSQIFRDNSIETYIDINDRPSIGIGPTYLFKGYEKISYSASFMANIVPKGYRYQSEFLSYRENPYSSLANRVFLVSSIGIDYSIYDCEQGSLNIGSEISYELRWNILMPSIRITYDFSPKKAPPK